MKTEIKEYNSNTVDGTEYHLNVFDNNGRILFCDWSTQIRSVENLKERFQVALADHVNNELLKILEEYTDEKIHERLSKPDPDYKGYIWQNEADQIIGAIWLRDELLKRVK